MGCLIVLSRFQEKKVYSDFTADLGRTSPGSHPIHSSRLSSQIILKLHGWLQSSVEVTSDVLLGNEKECTSDHDSSSIVRVLSRPLRNWQLEVAEPTH